VVWSSMSSGLKRRCILLPVRRFARYTTQNRKIGITASCGFTESTPDIVSLKSSSNTLTQLAPTNFSLDCRPGLADYKQSVIRFCATSGSFHKSSFTLYRVYATLQPYKFYPLFVFMCSPAIAKRFTNCHTY
jgi:hypothetical protein